VKSGGKALHFPGRMQSCGKTSAPKVQLNLPICAMLNLAIMAKAIKSHRKVAADVAWVNSFSGGFWHKYLWLAKVCLPLTQNFSGKLSQITLSNMS
jgi:hypothetical protein